MLRPVYAISSRSRAAEQQVEEQIAFVVAALAVAQLAELRHQVELVGAREARQHAVVHAEQADDAIEKAANDLLARKLKGVLGLTLERARAAPCVHGYDYIGTYVSDLANVLDIEEIRKSGIRIGIDPLGGAAMHYWAAHRAL